MRRAPLLGSARDLADDLDGLNQSFGWFIRPMKNR